MLTSAFFLNLALLAAPLFGFASQRNVPPSSEVARPEPFEANFTKQLSRGEYEYFKVRLSGDGRGEFEAKPRNGEAFQLTLHFQMQTMEQLGDAFDAAEFLTSSRLYESKQRVADMGMKTIRLRRGHQEREASFNYTNDRALTRIADFFERVIITQLRLRQLETTLKYDKLGLPKVLEGLETELNNRWLAEPQILVPILQKIAENKAVFNMAQSKARTLIARLETQKQPEIR